MVYFPTTGFSLVTLLVAEAISMAPGLSTTIQVCQNKDCCQRFHGSSNLVRTLRDLLPPDSANEIEIQSSGCLSQCGKGPNVSVRKKKGGREIFLHGIADAASAAAELDKSCSVTPNPTLLAAVNVMERAQKAQDPSEKLKFLNSVIKTLQNKGLSECSAIARAYCLRAQVYLDLKEYELAREDAHAAVTLKSDNAVPPSNAWRVVADVEEASGNNSKAIKALEKWAAVNPSFTTKANREIHRLSNAVSEQP